MPYQPHHTLRDIGHDVTAIYLYDKEKYIQSQGQSPRFRLKYYHYEEDENYSLQDYLNDIQDRIPVAGRTRFLNNTIISATKVHYTENYGTHIFPKTEEESDTEKRNFPVDPDHDVFVITGKQLLSALNQYTRNYMVSVTSPNGATTDLEIVNENDFPKDDLKDKLREDLQNLPFDYTPEEQKKVVYTVKELNYPVDFYSQKNSWFGQQVMENTQWKAPVESFTAKELLNSEPEKENQQGKNKDNSQTPVLGIYLANLAAYNNGELRGKWISLPITQEEWQSDCKDIGIGKKDEFGNEMEEWFVADYDSQIPGIAELGGDWADVEVLNQIAEDYPYLDSDEKEKLDALMESDYAPTELNELANLLQDPEPFNHMIIIEKGADDWEYGKHLLEESSLQENETILNGYFNFEEYGEKIKQDMTGENVGKDFVEANNFELDSSEPEIEEEIALTEEDLETLQNMEPSLEPYREVNRTKFYGETMSLLLSNPDLPENSQNMAKEQWIDLPTDKEEYLQVLRNMGIGTVKPDGTIYKNVQIEKVESEVPYVEERNQKFPYQESEIDLLNQIAENYNNLEEYGKTNLDYLYKTSYYPGNLKELANATAYKGNGKNGMGINSVAIDYDGADNEKFGQEYIDLNGWPDQETIENHFDYGQYGANFKKYDDYYGENLRNGDYLIFTNSLQLNDSQPDIEIRLFRAEPEIKSRSEDETLQFTDKEEPISLQEINEELQTEQQPEDDQEQTQDNNRNQRK